MGDGVGARDRGAGVGGAKGVRDPVDLKKNPKVLYRYQSTVNIEFKILKVPVLDCREFCAINSCSNRYFRLKMIGYYNHCGIEENMLKLILELFPCNNCGIICLKKHIL